MVIQHDDKVTFSINGEDLLKAIGTLKDMRKYLLEQKEVDEGKQELAKNLAKDLLVATETLSAFWCVNFADSGKKESGSQGQEELKESQPEIIHCRECIYAEVADAEDDQDGYTCQFHRGSIWFSGSFCSWAERLKK